MHAAPADPLPVTVVTLQTVETTTVQGTSVQVQASIVPLTIVTIIAAVLGSILGLILVGGAVALITCLVMRRRKLHKDSVAAIQGMVTSASTHIGLTCTLKHHCLVETTEALVL